MSDAFVDPNKVMIDLKAKTISLVGLHTLVVFILTLTLGWMGFLLYRSVEGQQATLKEALEEQTAQLHMEHMGIKDDLRREFGLMSLNQNKIADAMDSQTYLMTKSDKERQLYKLDMPDALRKRIR